MRSTRVAIFLVVGFVLSATALFAESIGLDKDPGWGKGRIGLLLLGITSLTLAYYSYSKSVQIFLKSTQLFIARDRQNIATPGKAIRSYWLAIPFLLFILVFYIWFVSSGRWNNWKSPTYYYDALADAFLHGNLYLSIKPDPQLLTLENPYDPLERVGIESPVDLSLYNGKFYMYWGPGPAIVPIVIQAVFGRQMGDLVLALVFACGLFLIEAWILLLIWDRYFHMLPQWTFFLAILLCGMTIPVVLLRHNYDDARIYEASISAGQFFLLAGFIMALNAITREHISNGHLTAAGILWAFAIGSRQVLAAPIGFMVLTTAWLLTKAQMSATARIWKFISLGSPFLLGFAGLSWYNWARFGSITETGLYYQLAGPNLQEHYTELFSRSYLIQNLYNYLLNPLDFTPKFPFVFMLKGNEKSVVPFYIPPEFYNAQPIAGLIYIFPFVAFAAILLIAFFSNLFKGRHDQKKLAGNDHKLVAWISLNMGGSFLISFCLLTVYFWVGIRFLGDFIPALTIFSSIGFWQGYRFLEDKSLAKQLYSLSGVILASTSMIVSMLLAISTNSRLINLITRIFPILR